jgi:hypothetical protein
MPAPEPGEQRAWPLLRKGAPAAGVAIALDLHLLLRHDLPPLYKILSLDPLNPKDNRLDAICTACYERVAIFHPGAEIALGHQDHDDSVDALYCTQSSEIRMGAAAHAGRGL